jgi:hypothetical protein
MTVAPRAANRIASRRGHRSSLAPYSAAPASHFYENFHGALDRNEHDAVFLIDP